MQCARGRMPSARAASRGARAWTGDRSGGRSAKEAIEALATESFDLVLTDLALGRGGSGLEVLREARRVRRETPVIVITAHGSERIAVEAMKEGAAHYVPKPFDNDELRLVVA